MLDLTGKWVLVTGAARGIGRLAALKMAEQGCNLILHSRDTSHTASLEEELKAMGVKCHSVSADLNDIPSVLLMLEKIDSLGVDVDIVLNNAGLQIAYRTDYYKTPADDYTVSFNVNGGTNAPQSQTVTSGGNIKKPVNNPEKSGCTFSGWVQKADDCNDMLMPTSPFNFNSPITSSFTLYACYTGTGCN